MTAADLQQLANEHTQELTSILVDADAYEYSPQEVSKAYEAGFKKALELVENNAAHKLAVQMDMPMADALWVIRNTYMKYWQELVS